LAATKTELVKRAGRLILVHEGKLFEVTLNVLHEIVEKFVVVPRLANRGSADEPYWVCEYDPYKPPEKIVRMLLTGAEQPLTVQRARGTNLHVRVPKV